MKETRQQGEQRLSAVKLEKRTNAAKGDRHGSPGAGRGPIRLGVGLQELEYPMTVHEKGPDSGVRAFSAGAGNGQRRTRLGCTTS
jgi:hypothetical protein